MLAISQAPWMTPDEAARQLRIAAARARCTVRSVRVADTAAGPRAIGDVVCADGWAASTMLLALSVADAETAGARDVALAIRQVAPADDDFATFVHQYVKDNVAFVREQGEIFAGPSYTMVARGGDCDDHVRLTYAILGAGGLPVRLAFLYHAAHAAEGPSHVVCQVFIDGAWRWCETTVDAAFGEDPLEAATRLGVVKSRNDLATEVRVMSEQDLPPIPPGFLSRVGNVDHDVAALATLGYLVGFRIEHLAADAGIFRDAVARFQRDHSLTIDGLIGPVTRAELARALSQIGPTPTPNIGAITQTTDLPDEFFALTKKMAEDFRAKGAKVSGEDFLAVWLSESGCNPHCQGQGCKGPTAPFADFGGLNMMNTQSRGNVGFHGTAEEWCALSAVEQFPFVRKFYEVDVAAFCGGSFACLKDVGSLYLLNFTPAFMSHANEPDFIIAGKNGPRAEIFRDNAGISRDGSTIRVSDMAPFALRATRSNPKRWAELQARIRAAGDPGMTPPPILPPSAPGGTGTLIAGAVVLGAMAAAYHFLT